MNYRLEEIQRSTSQSNAAVEVSKGIAVFMWTVTFGFYSYL